MNASRRRAAAMVAVGFAGGCQLLSGLSGLHPGKGAGGGSSASSTSTTGGGMGGGSASSTAVSTTSTGGNSASSVASSTSTTVGVGGGTSSTGTGGAGGGCPAAGPCALFDNLPPPGGGFTVTSLAVNSLNVYWSVQTPPGSGKTGRIDQLALGSASPPKIFQDGVFPDQIRVDEGEVYWIEDNVTKAGIYSASIAPLQGPSSLLYDETGSVPTQLDVSGVQLAWVVPAKFRISFGTLAGDMNVPRTDYTTTQLVGPHFAYDGTTWFWSDGSDVLVDIPMTGASYLLAHGPAANMVADANASNGFVYFTVDGLPGVDGGPGTGSVQRALKSNMMPLSTPVATTAITGDLLVDGANVYWVEYAGMPCASAATIQRAPLAGPSGSLFAGTTALTSCILLAQDNTYLYWVDGTTLYRQLK